MNTLKLAYSQPNRFPYCIELNAATLVFPNQHTAVVQVKTGTNVCQHMATDIHTRIAQELGGDYGLIVDRSEDYSLLPVPVFQFLNNWAPLKVIAIVALRSMSKTVTEIDKGLSRKPLQVFDNVAEAQLWLDQQLSPMHLVK